MSIHFDAFSTIRRCSAIIPFTSHRKHKVNRQQGKTYVYDFTTYLKDSNAQGNNYFARYFEWQGMCREAWFFECIAKDFLQPLGVFITKQAHNEYQQETYPFQQVRCLLNTREVRKASFYIIFRFCDADKPDTVFSSGYQQIAFLNHDHKIAKLPFLVVEKIREYSI